MKQKKIVLFGDSAFAEVAYELFTHDSPYEVAGFAVSREYKKSDSLFGKPVVAFEEVEAAFPPREYGMHVALVYQKLNRNRTRFYNEAKEKGYELVNYVSSRCFLWHNVEIGDNVFIFENNVIQPFVRLGSNIVLWSGNHVGHHSIIKNHCFISSHVVISGFCEIGSSCFLGVNSTIANNVSVGDDCLVGAGALITKSIPRGSFLKPTPTEVQPSSTYEYFGFQG